MKSFTLLLFSLLFSISSFSQNGVYLFGNMNNAPGTTFDISVVIYSNPPVTAQFTVNPDGSITNNQNYWVDLPSADWTHFEVIYPTCENETNILTVIGDSLPNMIDVQYEIDYCPSGNEIYGCTDFEAINFNPQATIDDGSCLYSGNCATIDLSNYCVDISSNAYLITIQNDPFCCNSQWDQFCQEDYEDNGGQPLPECEGVELIYGCTDPNAVNFNPNADVNDGSCEYENECTWVTMVLDGSSNNQGFFDLYADNGFVATGTYGGSNQTYEWCLEDGCYELFFVLGNGQVITDQVSYTIFMGDSIIDGGTFMDQTSLVDLGVNTSCDSSDIYGCTDPEAINYNPNATSDDGSCEYNNEVENDLCADATALQLGTQPISNVGAVNNENVWGECWAFGSGEGEQTSIWYSFTTPDVPATIHIEALGDGTNTLTDTQFGLFAECGGEMLYCDGNAGQGLFSAFHFECGELEENTTYILMIDGYFGDNGTCNLTYNVSTSCDVLGCTDPDAINYDPNATVDDGSCEYDEPCTNVNISFNSLGATQGFWDIYNENNLVAGGTYSGGPMTYSVCLEDGCYDLLFVMNDAAVIDTVAYSISVSDSIVTDGIFTQPTSQTSFGVNTSCEEEIYGCTDPMAINYNPNATVDDGSCEYEPCDANEVIVVINTSTWGNEISWNIVQDNVEIAGDSGYESDNAYTYAICLEDGCYSFEMFDSFGDGWNGGYFSIQLDGAILADGTLDQGEYGSIDFGVNTDCGDEQVFGCTDPNALNYNAEATIDDGSCEYESECTPITMILDGPSNNQGFFDLYSDNGYVATGTYGGSDQVYEWCLEDGCYELFYVMNSGGTVNNEVYYTLFQEDSIIGGGTFMNQTNVVNFGVNANCDSTQVYGCTDPAANNYNPSATIDDGSCEYDQDCVAVGDEFCVDTDSEAYFITITQDSFCCNNAWDQICQNAYISFGGPVGEDCEIYGCTDPQALNYNPEATMDDGSCEYQFDCAISFTVTPDSTGAQVIWITPTNNIFNAASVEWDFGDGTTSTALFPFHTYSGDGPYTLCLTAFFEEPNGGFCDITYCAVLSDEMINPPGMATAGFSINVLNPSETTGMDELMISSLNLWPNPASDQANIEFTLLKGANVNIEVFDVTGKVVASESLSAATGNNFHPIDVSNLRSGMYLVRLTGEAEQMTTRMIIQ